jgi:transcriptional antiterminator RfaH
MILPEKSCRAWFCVRSQPKHEHIGAAHLEQELDIEAFAPRIRFKRATRQGAAWFTEALFPSYFFARFDLASSLKKVRYARGVHGVVHFGGDWPIIPEAVIEDLRAGLGPEEIHVIPNELQPGDAIEVVSGVFHGLQAVVTRVMAASQRVAILFDFLGRQTNVELAHETVVRRDIGCRVQLLPRDC